MTRPRGSKLSVGLDRRRGYGSAVEQFAIAERSIKRSFGPDIDADTGTHVAPVLIAHGGGKRRVQAAITTESARPFARDWRLLPGVIGSARRACERDRVSCDRESGELRRPEAPGRTGDRTSLRARSCGGVNRIFEPCKRIGSSQLWRCYWLGSYTVTRPWSMFRSASQAVSSGTPRGCRRELQFGTRPSRKTTVSSPPSHPHKQEFPPLAGHVGYAARVLVLVLELWFGCEMFLAGVSGVL